MGITGSGGGGPKNYLAHSAMGQSQIGIGGNGTPSGIASPFGVPATTGTTAAGGGGINTLKPFTKRGPKGGKDPAESSTGAFGPSSSSMLFSQAGRVNPTSVGFPAKADSAAITLVYVSLYNDELTPTVFGVKYVIIPVSLTLVPPLPNAISAMVPNP